MKGGDVWLGRFGAGDVYFFNVVDLDHAKSVFCPPMARGVDATLPQQVFPVFLVFLGNLKSFFAN